jgi:hypothetical protein
MSFIEEGVSVATSSLKGVLPLIIFFIGAVIIVWWLMKNKVIR